AAAREHRGTRSRSAAWAAAGDQPQEPSPQDASASPAGAAGSVAAGSAAGSAGAASSVAPAQEASVAVCSPPEEASVASGASSLAQPAAKPRAAVAIAMIVCLRGAFIVFLPSEQGLGVDPLVITPSGEVLLP